MIVIRSISHFWSKHSKLVSRSKLRVGCDKNVLVCIIKKIGRIRRSRNGGTSIPDLRVAMLFSSSKRKSQEIAKKIVPSSLVESL